MTYVEEGNCFKDLRIETCLLYDQPTNNPEAKGFPESSARSNVSCVGRSTTETKSEQHWSESHPSFNSVLKTNDNEMFLLRLKVFYYELIVLCM